MQMPGMLDVRYATPVRRGRDPQVMNRPDLNRILTWYDLAVSGHARCKWLCFSCSLYSKGCFFPLTGQVPAEGCGCRSVPSVWCVLQFFFHLSRVLIWNSSIRMNESIHLWFSLWLKQTQAFYYGGWLFPTVSHCLLLSFRSWYNWVRHESWDEWESVGYLEERRKGVEEGGGDRSQGEPSKRHVGMKMP